VSPRLFVESQVAIHGYRRRTVGGRAQTCRARHHRGRADLPPRWGALEARRRPAGCRRARCCFPAMHPMEVGPPARVRASDSPREKDPIPYRRFVCGRANGRLRAAPNGGRPPGGGRPGKPGPPSGPALAVGAPPATAATDSGPSDCPQRRTWDKIRLDRPRGWMQIQSRPDRSSGAELQGELVSRRCAVWMDGPGPVRL
jgi:hypothetical protein